MDKAKTKKSDKIPKPIKIKKEKTEENRTLQSMAHYVDDRLELIKQIFSTLKPKTIVNLAPEYLKKKKMTKIEELCLTELVRISKKRLLSIVNGTKCPTDTESSEDSDVQPQEEHVSLEEVSSDSGADGEKKRKAKKKKMTKNNENNTADASKNKNNENDGEGVISVLELLELQARARAIRSQLALEPVTKIEVDAEDDKKPKTSIAGQKSQTEAKQTTQASVQSKEKERRRKRKSQDAVQTENAAKLSKECADNAKKIETENANKEKSTTTGKKIKLRRNYRNTNQNNGNQNNADKPAAENNKEVKVERKSRSPSPDVIPIVAEPVTLTITDSSDEEKKAKTAEGVMSKEVDKGGVRTESSVIVATQQQQVEKPPSDMEDGEISDKEANDVSDKPAIIITSNATEIKSLEKATNSAVTSSNDVQESKPIEIIESSNSNNSVTEMGTPKVTSSGHDDNSNLSSKLDTDDVAGDDDDDQDDVISIEGSDLETEIAIDLETEKNIEKPSNKPLKKEVTETPTNVNNKNAHISSGDESRDDNNDQESWRARYFKSNKVNKVLTASRLGKRVRDKIKKSKTDKKEKNSEAANNAAKDNKTVVFESKHEDGSVEQYRELLESTKRQNDSKKA